MIDIETLYKPIRVGRIELPNRIAMAPMARFRCRTDGTPHPYVATHFSQRADAGLLIADSVYVDVRGRMSEYLGGICTDAQQEGWAEVAEQVHAAGGRIFLSLIHSGRVSERRLQTDNARPVAPSAIKPRQANVPRVKAVRPRALSTKEVAELARDFGRSARRAIDAGFDGVELHAANGYIGAQFLASESNKRTDRYGGSIAGRCRFVIEAAEAIAGEIGGDRMGLKMSPGFQHHDNFDCAPVATHRYLLAALEDLGLAYVHTQSPIKVFGLYHDLDFDPIAVVRDHWCGTLIASGNLDRALAAEGVASGKFDIAAFGRRFVANPDLTQRIFKGWPENELDPATLDAPGLEGYIDYPRFKTA